MTNIENILRKDLGFKPFKESLGHNVNRIKPFNSFRYAEALSIISGDKYLQENTTLNLAYGYSEAKKEGDEGAMKKFGKKVVAYAKDTWKVIKVLIGKLVILIEESISKLFDKTKKVEKTLKYLQQLVKDNKNKMDGSVEFDVSHPKFMNLSSGNSNGNITGGLDKIEEFMKQVRSTESKADIDALYKSVESAGSDALKYSKDWKELKKEIKELLKDGSTNTSETAADVKSIFTEKGLSAFISNAFAFIAYVVKLEKAYREDKERYNLLTSKVKFENSEDILSDLVTYAKAAIEENVKARKVYFEQKRLGLHIKNMPEKKLANFKTADLTALRKMINANSSYAHRLNKLKEYEIQTVAKALAATYKSLNKALKSTKKK